MESDFEKSIEAGPISREFSGSAQFDPSTLWLPARICDPECRDVGK